MSMSLNKDWMEKLKPFPKEYSEEQKTTITGTINKFKRDEIFKNNYDEKDLFEHIYKESSQGEEAKAKRQPNPFMIFRIILGKIAASKNIKLGDGTQQSRIAGFMWKGITSPDEKKKFEDLATQFKNLHKKKFPSYEYKPKQRNPVPNGTFVETITRSNFEPTFNDQQMPQQPILEENCEWEASFSPFENAIDPGFMMNGDLNQQFAYQQYQLYQQPQQFLQLAFPFSQFLLPESSPFVDYSYTFDKHESLDKLNPPQETQPSISSNCLNSQFDPNMGNDFFPYNNN